MTRAPTALRARDGSLPARMVALARNLPQRLHERPFWVTQAGVLGITAAHLLGEMWGAQTDLSIPSAFHHIPVVLYLGPISYASLRFGTEGAVLTGLWSALLTVPNLLLFHGTGWEWLSELFYIAVVIAVGAIMALPVERERVANELLQESERQRLRSYARLVTQAQEEERKRIARELHDEAAQNVVVIRRDLGALAASLAETPVATELGRLRDLAGQTLAGIRRFSRDLRPPTLDELGLSSALDQLVTQVRERNGPAAELRVAGPPRRLPIETELAVFRIGQAAVHNVEHHSGAATVAVELAFEPTCLRLTITDDGCGFEPPEHIDELPQDGKLGLIGMLERAQLVGGTLEIESHPGAGTCVRLDVPG